MERLPTRLLSALLGGTVGCTALAGCTRNEAIPIPSASPIVTSCSGFPKAERVDGGFRVNCTLNLYDPQDRYNQRPNPGGIKSDALAEDIPAGETFGVSCMDLTDKPHVVIIPTHNSQTGKPMLGAANLTPEGLGSLQGQDIPHCDPTIVSRTA